MRVFKFIINVFLVTVAVLLIGSMLYDWIKDILKERLEDSRLGKLRILQPATQQIPLELNEASQLKQSA